MRIILVLIILVIHPSLGEARFISGASGTETQAAGGGSPSSIWSWSFIKQKVASYFVKDSGTRAPASTESAGAAPIVAAPEAKTENSIASVLKGTSADKFGTIAKSIEKQNLIQIAVPAREPAVTIPRSSSGVPVFSLEETKTKQGKNGKTTSYKVQISKIPRLDIGTEAKVQGHDFEIDKVDIPLVTYEKIQARKSPEPLSRDEITKALNLVVAKVGSPLTLGKKEETLAVATLKKVAEINYQLGAETPTDIKIVKEMNEEDLKFIRGLILYVAGDKCHFAAGIFGDLQSSSRPEIRTPSQFYLGNCLSKMGLFTEASEHLSWVLENDTTHFRNDAAEVMIAFPDDFYVRLGKKLEAVIGSLNLKPESKVKANYIIAESALKRDSHATALKFASLVPEGSDLYNKSQYIIALSEYLAGNIKGGLERLKKLQTLLPKENVHKDLHAMISLNLARMAFQDKNYKEASQLYLAIDKSHPLWIQALMEHGWSQLSEGDNEGAIGNMFSLQSTYLKSVYKPESYVIRAIGYINLCQYPDAYKSLMLLEREYRPWLSRMEDFLKKNPSASPYYTTMIRYLSSPSTTEIGSLPYQVLREMGRHKDFLNIQEGINTLVDENEQYKFLQTFIRKDNEKVRWLKSQAQQRLRTLEANIKKAGKDQKFAKELNQNKQNRNNELSAIEFYEFELAAFKEAVIGLNKVEDHGKKKIAASKADLAQKAGEVLQKRMMAMSKELISYFDNNEFLRYEVFAGSGENIRYHMAGGETANRVPSNVKPESKNLSWEFEGEFWEDEIGHYKTSLKDNCANVKRAAQK